MAEILKDWVAWALMAALIGGGCWGALRSRKPDLRPTIEYNGEHFKLTKAYGDFDDYKNDPENLDSSENGRVEHAVTKAKLAHEYPNREQMTVAVFKLAFPGYGITGIGEKPQTDGCALACFLVEIPRVDKDRVLVFQMRRGVYTLLDDFVWTSAGDRPHDVTLREGALVYSNGEGRELVVRPLEE